MFPQALLIKLGIYAGMAAAVLFAGWMVVHTIQRGAIKNIVAQDTAHAAQVDAAGARIDAAQARVDVKSAEDSSTHQIAEAKVAAVVKQKVYIHVHDPVAPRAVGCVSYGLVRQHDAAALGVDPDTLPLPSGVTDDACSPVANTELAGAIADNYAAARANAAQLNDLIANVKGKVDATNPPH